MKNPLLAIAACFALRRVALVVLAAGAFSFWAIPLAGQAAEVFVLRTGGRVQGQWLNKDEDPREKFVMRTASGGEIAFSPQQIVRVIEQSEDELLYDKLRPQTPDTVAGHEQMAAWCVEHKLVPQRHTHLERILELDPNHADARAALGYIKSHGEWMTGEELKGSQGLIRYRGGYRTPQEILLWEEENRAKQAQNDWAGRLKRWRSWLYNDKRPEAMEEFRRIKDPHAVPALASAIQANEPRAMKLLYIETLAQIDGGAGLRPLVECSLKDPDQEVRLSALDAIVRMNHPDAINLYVMSLRSKVNDEINRAAHALRTLGDPAAIEPLFDVLVTEHKFKIEGAPAGQTTTTFRPGGGGGMSFGGGGPKIITRQFKNTEVLVALVKLTGQNYSYDVNDWKRWYASRQRAGGFNARRDSRD